MKFEDIEKILYEVEKIEKHIEVLENYNKFINKEIKREKENVDYVKVLKCCRSSNYSNIRTCKTYILKYNEKLKEMYNERGCN